MNKLEKKIGICSIPGVMLWQNSENTYFRHFLAENQDTGWKKSFCNSANKTKVLQSVSSRSFYVFLQYVAIKESPFHNKHFYWCIIYSNLKSAFCHTRVYIISPSNRCKKYQPSGARGTRSPPATPHRLPKSKWPMGSGKVSTPRFLGILSNCH